MVELQPWKLVGFSHLPFNWVQDVDVFKFWVFATQIFFDGQPYTWEKWSNLDEHIFQLGWNHQLVFIQLRFRDIMKQQVCGIQNVYSSALNIFWRMAAGPFIPFCLKTILILQQTVWLDYKWFCFHRSQVPSFQPLSKIRSCKCLLNTDWHKANYISREKICYQI